MNRILLFLFSICIVSDIYSQVFRNLSVKDGLSDLVVSSIYKDSAGYVWFGTASSVERFDGVYLKRFTVPVANEKEKEVNVVIGMPDREIWFGTNGGLWRIAGDGKVERVGADEITGKVFALLHDGSGKVYVGSENGLFIYEDAGITRIVLEQNVLAEANVINGLILDSGTLWMATLDGLYAMSATTREVRSYKPDNKDIPTSYQKAYMLKKTIYLGTSDSGIVSFSIEKEQFEHYMNLGSVTALSGDGENTLYVGTNGGGIYFISAGDRKIIRNIRHDSEVADGLHSNSVYSLLVDDMGIVWAGFYQLGVDYSLYQNGLFEVFQHLPDINLRYLAIRTIETGAEGMLIGTRDGLFYADEKRGVYKRFASSELRSQMIMCSCLFEGKFYVGTYGGGMYVLDPKTVTLSDFEPRIRDPFITGNVFSITSDYKDNLWIATSRGVFRYEDGQLKSHYHSKNSKLPEENIYRIYFDSMHRGWVCADSRLLLIEPSSGRYVTDRFPQGFVDRKLIRDIYEDSCHNLYFLPDKGHLFVSDLALSRFHEMSGTPLDGKSLRFMIEDDENWLWIGTDDGLFRYDKGDNFISYGYPDGIPSSVFLNCIPKKGADGTLWFGNSQGLIYTRPDRIDRAEKSPYPLRITDVAAGGEHYCPADDGGKGSRLSIGAPKEKLTIRFSGFTYTDPLHMAYEFRLEGKDERWEVLSGVSEVSYYGLPAGDYVFRLRHLGNAGSETTLRLSVSSAVPFRPLVLGVILLACTGGCLLYRLLRKRNPVPPAEAEMPEVSEAPEAVQKYKSSNITDEECRELVERLKEMMLAERIYINPELKIVDLAHRLGVPAYKLSYLFNQYLNLSFYDYVNDYRIAEFKELVSKGEHRLYTINTLMERCGFVSRTTFFRYFKKKNGRTPSEYIKNLK